MERILSDEEKFRKAEEIYNRRRNINVTVPARDLNKKKEKGDLKRFRKMLIQIGVSVCIYFCVYFAQCSNQYFSNDIMKKVEDILTYDINFGETFKVIGENIKNNNFLNGVLFFLNNEEGDKNEKLNIQLNNVNLNSINLNNINENFINANSIIENNIDFNNLTEGIEAKNETLKNNEVGSVENIDGTSENNNDFNENEENTSLQPTLGIGGGETSSSNSSADQMSSDAEKIKKEYNLTLPLRGTITSRYGDREIEPTFHTGIDIARNEGSEIISAMSGTVILAEEQKSYGKVIKIQDGDLITLYAHCSELLVNVGDRISIRQKIAKVGSTGNSTGPHLHFEIIYCGRYVNPEYIMEFKE